MKLDNAAKIYPPASTRGWTAMFRLSVTLTEPVDPAALEKAQEAVLKRIPTFAYRLRRGVFWYYFEHMRGAPALQRDVGNPLVRMDFSENGHFMYRVRYYRRRIAVEFFHALTDGTGGMSFLLTLAAEYMRVKYGLDIPAVGPILDPGDAPLSEEMEDSFLKHARNVGASRAERPAYHARGTPEHTHFLNITTGIMPQAAVVAKAKELGVSVTALFAALLIDSIQEIQFADPRARKRRLPVKVLVPVNLRRFYGAKTLRNFASYVNVGVDSRYGRWTFPEILNAVKHTMGLEISEKTLNARMSANVNAEKNFLVRAMPLVLKAPFLRVMFMLQGDRYNSTTLSNLGEVVLPEAMRPYVERLDFLLGVPVSNPVTCACVSYGGSVYLSFSRRTREPDIERAFFTALVKMGVPVKVESNRR
jgi:NRPS condensation-like uncharacterized protein